MVIEHDFVTTREAAEVLRDAREMLMGCGFGPPAWGDGRVGSLAKPGLLLVRGKGGRRRPTPERPQQYRLDYDRGRVCVSLLLPDDPKLTEEVKAWGFAGARASEALVTQRLPWPQAVAPWLASEQRLRERSQRRIRRARRLLGAGVVAFFLIPLLYGLVMALLDR